MSRVTIVVRTDRGDVEITERSNTVALCETDESSVASLLDAAVAKVRAVYEIEPTQPATKENPS